MEALRDTIVAIAALVIISGAVDLLISGKGLRGFARFACGLLLMLAMLTPLYSLLSLEPARLIGGAQETISRAECIHMDDAVLRQQAEAAAESAGAKVRIRAIEQNDGRIESIEVLMLTGDEDAARYALCWAFGLNDDQVVFQ